MKIEEFLRKRFKQISESDIFLSIVTEDYLKDSGRCVFELGLAVLLDKPIRLCVKKGTKVPQRLLSIAEKIEYFDTPDSLQSVGRKLLEDK